MSFAATPAVANPPLAGGVVSASLPQTGKKLLGLMQRMMQTGWAMARHVRRIAREHLSGQDLAQLAPAGFDAFRTDARIGEAVAWTAALRERLRARAVPPAFAPELPKNQQSEVERAPRGRGTPVTIEVDAGPEWTEGKLRAWIGLARPWRLGPDGVTFAAQKIAALSDRQVVAAICENLRLAAVALGAEADVARIAALEAAARALCPEVDGVSGEAGDAPAAWAGSGPATTSDLDDEVQTEPEGGQDPPPA